MSSRAELPAQFTSAGSTRPPLAGTRPPGAMAPRVERALQRLRAVFLHIPDARLSLADAVRLAEMEAYLCQVLLTALEDLRFLTRGPDGVYERRGVEQGE